MNESDADNQGKPLDDCTEGTDGADREFDGFGPENSRLRNADREEMLDAMLEQTRSHLDDDSFHEKFTQYVRQNRLPSRFDFDNVCELVRCVLKSTKINQLSVDAEECVTWIATCLYEDPLSRERIERLWNSILGRIQG